MPEATTSLADDIRQTIVHAARLKIEPGEITPEARLYGPGSLGLHSIDIFDLVTELETKFEIRVEDDDIPKLNSVAEIQAFIEARRNG